VSKLVLRFLKDNSGATAIEYGLIAAGIAIIAALQLTGTVVKVEFKPHGIAEFGPSLVARAICKDCDGGRIG
jgi:pilus assembly protein Flp/PilA